MAELDGNNTVMSRFVYGTRAHVPDFMVKGGTTYRILSDHVGSVRLVVNADTGAVVQQIDYDAFGVVAQDTNPGFQPFGFAGGLTDPDTGLVRFGARDYDPRVGRWTSKDPIRFGAVGSNLYGYALGDPVNLVDIDGRDVDNTAGSTVVLVLGGGRNEPFGGDSGAVRCLPAGQVDEGVHDAVAVPGTGIIYKTPDLSSVRISSTGGVSPSGPLSTVLINYGGGGPIPASEVPQHGASFEGLLGDANALGAYPYLGGDCQCTE